MPKGLNRPGIKPDGSFECDGFCALIDENGIFVYPMENCPGYSWCKELSKEPQKGLHKSH